MFSGRIAGVANPLQAGRLQLPGRRSRTDSAGSVGGRLMPAAFLLDALVDLFTVHGHVPRRIDADFDLVAVDSGDRHGDVVTDVEGFANAAGEYQHGPAPWAVGIPEHPVAQVLQ